MTTEMSVRQNLLGHGFVDELNGAVRANPIAAGLIGMGVLWMFFGGAKTSIFGSAFSGAQQAIGAVGSGGGAVTRAVGDGLAATGTRAGGLARDVGDSITKVAQGAGEFARDTMTSGINALTSSGHEAAHAGASDADVVLASSKSAGHEFSTALQRKLSATLERQPLVLGAIGIAIGAGIASTFASTQTENEFMGETGATIKDGVRSVVSDVAGIASQAVDDMTTEADRQGLTPSAIMGQLNIVGDRLKTVAGAARDSVKQRLT